MPRGQKTCPNCEEPNGPRTKVCKCGHEFSIKGKTTPVPTSVPPGPPPMPPPRRGPPPRPTISDGSTGPVSLPIEYGVRNISEVERVELHDLMLAEAERLAKRLDTFRQTSWTACRDDIWLKCWRTNFRRLHDALKQTLEIAGA